MELGVGASTAVYPGSGSSRSDSLRKILERGQSTAGRRNENGAATASRLAGVEAGARETGTMLVGSKGCSAAAYNRN